MQLLCHCAQSGGPHQAEYETYNILDYDCNSRICQRTIASALVTSAILTAE
jgi:hypothetical protein